MPLDYLSCFAMVLEGYTKRWYIPKYIRSKLRSFPYSKVTHGSTTFKLKKRQFNYWIWCFVFFIPLSHTISVINRDGTCYFLHASKQWCRCWHVHMRSHTSNKKTVIVSQKERNSLTCFNAKVQINNVKMEIFFFHPPACLRNLWWQPLTVHISYMASIIM